jgi:hypothetical protein
MGVGVVVVVVGGGGGGGQSTQEGDDTLALRARVEGSCGLWDRARTN